MTPTERGCRTISVFVVVLSVALTSFRCGKEPKCDDTAKAELKKCQNESDNLRNEVVTLKRKLAQALANPGMIKVDPSLLVIDGKPIEVKPPQEGTLTQDQVIQTWNANKKALRACYERGMKKNTALTMQKITLTVGFSVKPTGDATGIRISPNYDNTMNDCMKKAIRRWQFPRFTGQPVGVEMPLTLVPRK